MDNDLKALGFDVIIEKLQQHAVSGGAKAALGELSPCLDARKCLRNMDETTEARKMLDVCGSPPLATMNGLDELITLSAAGAMLTPEQLTGVARFASACRRLAGYLKKGETCAPVTASYGSGIRELSELQSEIERCVDDEKVYDTASPELKNIRRKLERAEAQLKEKLNHILSSRKQFLADSYIANRGGHYVLPVQRQFQGKFGGRVIEVSAKGSTVFMAPDATEALQAELDSLAIDEDCEARRILYMLSSMVADSADALKKNMACMEKLDALFAKAKLAAALKAEPAELTETARIQIKQGRHPLLDEAACVPLDFCMEEGTLGVIITGPNTGGKTVALKTVGLLCAMAQSGLHIPASPGSVIPLRDAVYCDIGDSQDISQNLSTFSGHITNVIRVLQSASRDSLVLLDELGSGTDPAEGMGIAVAVLEEFRRRGCMFLVTTHYPQVKSYAEKTEGVVAARMAFDRESLRPLYRLEMGRSGESCALYIAGRLGLAPQLIERARAEVYGGKKDENAAMPAPASRLQRLKEKKPESDVSGKFTMGDSVTVLPAKEPGIVYRPADKNGDVIVQVKGKKVKVRHDRLLLRVPAAELYPPDYDFSIIFDTVENRKARHIMSKRYDADAVITYGAEDYPEL